MISTFRFPFLFFMVLLLLTGCANNPSEKETAAESPADTITESPADNLVVAPADTISTVTVDVKPENPAVTSTKVPAEKAPEKIAAPNVPMKKTLPPTPAPENKSKKKYPSGYISRKNVPLQGGPSQRSPQLRTFKIYDTVYIMETKMTDDAGNVKDIPTWYKVQCTDNQIGWVESRNVTVN